MTALVFYFQVHQPWRLRRYTFFDIGKRHDYFDDAENERILKRVAEKCYLPMTALLEEQVNRHEGAFRCCFSITGQPQALHLGDIITPALAGEGVIVEI